MESQPRKVQIPEIWESESEQGLSNKDLKAECFYFARQHFQGKNFVNISTNKHITVSRDGLGEWKTKTKTREQTLSIKILDFLLENGTTWKTETPKNNDANIKKIIYFRQNCRINGLEYTAIITVKSYKAKDYYKYYHHYLDDSACVAST